MSTNPVVATRKTFDGVTVYLHSNGELSTVMYFVKGGKLPLASMWRFAEDICLMTFKELPDQIRAEKKGKRRPFAIRDWVPEAQRVYVQGPRLANGLTMDYRVR